MRTSFSGIYSRILISLLSFTVGFDSSLLSQVTARSSKPVSLPENLKNSEISLSLQNLILPGMQNGKTFKGHGESQFILIRDLHCQEEAQIKIAQGIELLNKKHGVKQALIEGAEGLVRTGLYSSFPDDKIRQQVASEFLKEGYLSGAEYAAIKMGKNADLTLYGVEDASLYIENFRAFRNTRKLYQSKLKSIKKIDEWLRTLKKEKYSKELLSLDSALEKIWNGEIDVESLINGVKSFESYQELKALEEWEKVFKDSKAINPEKIQTSLSSLINHLQKQLVQEEMKEVIQWTLEYRFGKIRISEYLSRLKQKAGEATFNQEYPILESWRDLSQRQESLDIEQLIKSCQSKLQEQMIKLSKQENVEPLLNLDQHWKQIHHLIKLELSRSELEELKKNGSPTSTLGDDKPTNFLSFPKAVIGNPFFERSDKFKLDIQDLIQSAWQFYELAQKRDHVLAQNALRALKSPVISLQSPENKNTLELETGDRKQATILITGGFHTEAIQKQLEESNISYSTWTPIVSGDISKSLYEKIMMDERFDLDNIEFSQKRISTRHDKDSIHQMLASPSLIAEFEALGEVRQASLQQKIVARFVNLRIGQGASVPQTFEEWFGEKFWEDLNEKEQRIAKKVFDLFYQVFQIEKYNPKSETQAYLAIGVLEEVFGEDSVVVKIAQDHFNRQKSKTLAEWRALYGKDWDSIFEELNKIGFFFDSTEKRELREAIEKLNLKEGQKYLHVGMALNKLVFLLSLNGVECVFVDLDPDIMGSIRVWFEVSYKALNISELLPVRFITKNIDNVMSKDGLTLDEEDTFDVISMFHVFFNFNGDMSRAIGNLLALVKPEGILWFTPETTLPGIASNMDMSAAVRKIASRIKNKGIGLEEISDVVIDGKFNDDSLNHAYRVVKPPRSLPLATGESVGTLRAIGPYKTPKTLSQSEMDHLVDLSGGQSQTNSSEINGKVIESQVVIYNEDDENDKIGQIAKSKEFKHAFHIPASLSQDGKNYVFISSKAGAQTSFYQWHEITEIYIRSEFGAKIHADIGSGYWPEDYTFERILHILAWAYDIHFAMSQQSGEDLRRSPFRSSASLPGSTLEDLLGFLYPQENLNYKALVDLLIEERSQDILTRYLPHTVLHQKEFEEKIRGFVVNVLVEAYKREAVQIGSGVVLFNPVVRFLARAAFSTTDKHGASERQELDDSFEQIVDNGYIPIRQLSLERIEAGMPAIVRTYEVIDVEAGKIKFLMVISQGETASTKSCYVSDSAVKAQPIQSVGSWLERFPQEQRKAEFSAFLGRFTKFIENNFDPERGMPQYEDVLVTPGGYPVLRNSSPSFETPEAFFLKLFYDGKIPRNLREDGIEKRIIEVFGKDKGEGQLFTVLPSTRGSLSPSLICRPDKNARDEGIRNCFSMRHAGVTSAAHMEGLKLKVGGPIRWRDQEIKDENVFKIKEAAKAQSTQLDGKIEGKAVWIDNEILYRFSEFGFESQDDFVHFLKEYLAEQFKTSPPQQNEVMIALLSSSTHLFEDHKTNGFIGINAQLFSQTISPQLRRKLLMIGLRHELRHESSVSNSVEDETILLKEDALYARTLGMTDQELLVTDVFSRESELIQMLKNSVFLERVKSILLNSSLPPDWRVMEAVALIGRNDAISSEVVFWFIVDEILLSSDLELGDMSTVASVLSFLFWSAHSTDSLLAGLKERFLRKDLTDGVVYRITYLLICIEFFTANNISRKELILNFVESLCQEVFENSDYNYALPRTLAMVKVFVNKYRSDTILDKLEKFLLREDLRKVNPNISREVVELLYDFADRGDAGFLAHTFNVFRNILFHPRSRLDVSAHVLEKLIKLCDKTSDPSTAASHISQLPGLLMSSNLIAAIENTLQRTMNQLSSGDLNPDDQAIAKRVLLLGIDLLVRIHRLTKLSSMEDRAYEALKQLLTKAYQLGSSEELNLFKDAAGLELFLIDHENSPKKTDSKNVLKLSDHLSLVEEFNPERLIKVMRLLVNDGIHSSDVEAAQNIVAILIRVKLRLAAKAYLLGEIDKIISDIQEVRSEVFVPDFSGPSNIALLPRGVVAGHGGIRGKTVNRQVSAKRDDEIITFNVVDARDKTGDELQGQLGQFMATKTYSDLDEETKTAFESTRLVILKDQVEVASDKNGMSFGHYGEDRGPTQFIGEELLKALLKHPPLLTLWIRIEMSRKIYREKKRKELLSQGITILTKNQIKDPLKDPRSSLKAIRDLGLAPADVEELTSTIIKTKVQFELQKMRASMSDLDISEMVIYAADEADRMGGANFEIAGIDLGWLKGRYLEEMKNQLAQILRASNPLSREIYENYESLSLAAAEKVKEQILQKPNSVLLFPTGNTPKGMYRHLARMAKAGEIDFSEVTIFMLDEYEGGRDYYNFIHENLIHKLPLGNRPIIHVLNGQTDNVNLETKAYEDKIQAAGGIDLAILGLGVEGHIAFNEKGASPYTHTRRFKLAQSTIEANPEAKAKGYTHALTTGIGTILEARKILVLANGPKKAKIIKELLDHAPTKEIPATYLKFHSNVTLMMDKEAAGQVQEPKNRKSALKAFDAIYKILERYSNVHRGTGQHSQVSTHLFEQARFWIGEKLGADRKQQEVILGTHPEDMMEALAHDLRLTPSDGVISDSEEPWSFLNRTGLPLRNGEIDFGKLKAVLRKGAVKVLSIQHPVQLGLYPSSISRLSKLAHRYGVKLIVDASEWPYKEVNAKSLGVDYLIFEGGKISPFAPTVVLADRSLLKTDSKESPRLRGGGTKKFNSQARVIWADAPDKFEVGSPNIVGTILLGSFLKNNGRLPFGESVARALPQKRPFTIDSLRESLIGKDLLVPTLYGDKVYVNFDNSSSTPTFVPILEAIEQYVFASTDEQTRMVAQALDAVFDYFGTSSEDHEHYSFRNTSEAANYVAHEFITSEDDVVVNSFIEHNSNELPWRSEQSQIRLEPDANGFFDPAQLEKFLIEYNIEKKHGRKRIKLVAISGASNVLGTVNNLKEIGELARKYDVKLMVDAAQLSAHREVNMEEWNIDFLVYSAHKIYAPFGHGGLIARKGLLKKKRAVVPAPEGLIAVARSFEILKKDIGLDAVAHHEEELLRYALGKFQDLNKKEGVNVQIYGINDTESDNIKNKTGVIVFNLQIDDKYLPPSLKERKFLPYNLVAAILAEEGGIGGRAGCFCADLLIQRLWGLGEKQIAELQTQSRSNQPGAVRISFGIYNTKEEIDRVFEVLNRLVKGEIDLSKYKFNEDLGEYYTHEHLEAMEKLLVGMEKIVFGPSEEQHSHAHLPVVRPTEVIPLRVNEGAFAAAA